MNAPEMNRWANIRFPTAADCPDKAKHTRCPEGYLAWHDWAEKKFKTHDNVLCHTCGFYAMWVPRSVVAADQSPSHTAEDQA